MKKRVYESLNTSRIEECYQNQIKVPQAYPKYVVLDVTNRCNYRCPLCPTGSGRSQRTIGDMDPELAIRVIQECAGFVENISFGFSGEPLLYRGLLPLIAEASRLGVRTKLFTNLSVVPEGGYEELIKSGIDYINVSLDGTNEKEYSFYRKCGNFSQVIQNVQSLIQANKCASKPCNIIEAQMLINKANENSKERFVTMCRSLGFDKAKLKYLNLGLDAGRSEADLYLPTDEKLHYYQIKDDSVMIRDNYLRVAETRACAELYYGPAIVAWDGRYILCCRDQRHEINMGAFQTTSVWDYWNGSQLAEKRMLQKAHQLPPCDMCPASFLETFEVSKSASTESEHTFLEKPAYRSSVPAASALNEVDYSDISEFSNWHGTKKIVNRGDIVDYGSYRTFKY